MPSTCRVAVGGATENVSGKGSGGKGKQNQRQNSDIEFFNYHPMDSKLWEEVVHQFGGKCVVDLTCSDFRLAYNCLVNRVPYFGFAFTDPHQKIGMDYLHSKIMQAYADERSPLFQASFASLLEEIGAEDCLHLKNHDLDNMYRSVPFLRNSS